MEQMRGRVVVHRLLSFVLFNNSMKRCLQVSGELFCKMNDQLILFLRISDNDFLSTTFDVARITNLSSTFSIERSLIKNQLNKLFTLLFDLAILNDANFGCQMVISDEFGFLIITN